MNKYFISGPDDEDEEEFTEDDYEATMDMMFPDGPTDDEDEWRES